MGGFSRTTSMMNIDIVVKMTLKIVSRYIERKFRNLIIERLNQYEDHPHLSGAL